MKHLDRFGLPAAWLQEDDLALAESVTRWAEGEVIAKRLEHHEDVDRLLQPAYRTLVGELGLARLFWPPEQNGAGVHEPAAAVTCAAIVEQVARADVGLAIALADTWAVQARVAVGASRDPEKMAALEQWLVDEQARPVAPVLPDYRGADENTLLDGLPFPARAEKTADGLALFATELRPHFGALHAAAFAVPIHVDNDVAVALVSSDSPGITLGEPLPAAGLAFSQQAPVTLYDVAVKPEYVLCSGDAAWRALSAWIHLGVAAAASGAGLATYDILRDWVDNRVIKGRGQSFKENPLVASLLGRIAGMLGENRLAAFAVAQIVSGADDRVTPAMYGLIVHTTRQTLARTRQSLNHAMELMASAGYASEWQLERYWRDIKTLETTLGPEPAARLETARPVFDLATL